MNHWKVGTRITAGFGIVVAIAVALGLFAYLEVGKINKSALDVTDDALPGVYLVGNIAGELTAEESFRASSRQGLQRHHALADARALRASYLVCKAAVVDALGGATKGKP